MKKRIFTYLIILLVVFAQGCLADSAMPPVGARHHNLTNEELYGFTSNATSTKPQEKEELIRIIMLVGIVLLLFLILILRFQHTFIEEYNKSDLRNEK